MTEEQVKTCRDMESRFYWQVQEMHGWKYAWHEKVMVRYFEEAQLSTDVFMPFMEYLKGQEGVTEICLHGKMHSLEGVWKAKDAWYTTQEGDVDPTTKLKRVRVYQALICETDDVNGDGPYVVENGCRYKVSHTFHWRVAALPDVPESSSGVSWTMQGVTRDAETGLFSCVLEKRERVEQTIEKHVYETDVFEEKTREEHLGVKGETTEGGKEASLANGVKTTRTVRKNEDCTHDVVNETITPQKVEGARKETQVALRGTTETTLNRNMPAAAPVTDLQVGDEVVNEKTEFGLWSQTIRKVTAKFNGVIRRVCSKTVFREEHAETTVVETAPTDTHAAEADAETGTVSEKTATQNEMGTWDVTDRSVKENQVTGAVVEISKELGVTTTSTTDRSVEDPGAEEGLEIGESVRSQKTDSGRWDVTKRKRTLAQVARAVVTCIQHAFEHRHEEESFEVEDPGEVELEAADGEIRERSVQKMADGRLRVRSSVRTAKSGTAEGTGGALKAAEEVTSIKNAETTDDFKTTPGEGERIEVSIAKNEFGRFDGTIRKTTVENAQGATDVVNPLVKVEETVDTSTTPKPDQVTAAAGTVVSMSVVPDAMGRANLRKTVRTGVAKEEYTTWTDTHVSESSTTKTTTVYNNTLYVYRNQSSVPNIYKEVESQKAGQDEAEPGAKSASVSLSINEFGLYDVTVHIREYVSTTIESKDGGGAGGEQGDSRATVYGERRMQVKTKDGKTKIYVMRKQFKVRYLWSTRTNMLEEINGGMNFPAYGVTSKIMGWYAMIVEEDLTGNAKWELETTLDENGDQN